MPNYGSIAKDKHFRAAFDRGLSFVVKFCFLIFLFVLFLVDFKLVNYYEFSYMYLSHWVSYCVKLCSYYQIGEDSVTVSLYIAYIPFYCFFFTIVVFFGFIAFMIGYITYN